jgi:hypothetical protein
MTHADLLKLFKQARDDFMAWRRKHAPTPGMLRRMEKKP